MLHVWDPEWTSCMSLVEGAKRERERGGGRRSLFRKADAAGCEC